MSINYKRKKQVGPRMPGGLFVKNAHSHKRLNSSTRAAAERAGACRCGCGGGGGVGGCLMFPGWLSNCFRLACCCLWAQ